MKLADFSFDLPEKLIAQEALADRAASRMMVVDRAAGTCTDHVFREFPRHLRPGDCVVLNDTRVIPARLSGKRRPGGGAAEIFLLERVGDLWRALVKPGKHLRPGAVVDLAEDLTATIIESEDGGRRLVQIDGAGDIEKAGHVPLPPYIHRTDRPEDRERYQTIYARESGSVAAPTAGLHFTRDVLAAIPHAERVTLHVGLGTFAPIYAENVEDVRLHPERYSVEPTAWQRIQAARRRIAVGTTTLRTLESIARTGALSGETDIFLYPGCKFDAVDALLTNFHLPASSLFLLICAFGGTELMKAAYAHAIQRQYRFYSYGDCMLIV